MREITTREQKKDQDAILDYQEKYRILTEMIPYGAFRLGPGPDYRIVSANRKLSQMLGYESPDYLKDKSVLDLMVDPHTWHQIETGLDEAESVAGFELQLKRKEGSGILVVLNASVLPSADHKITWIEGILEDVTEQTVTEMEMQYHEAELNRFAQSLNQANKKLNLLSSITRHDILNQLTAFLGYLELIEEETDNPKIKKYIELEKSIAETIRKQIQFTKDYHEIGVKSPQWFDVEKTIQTVTAPLPLSNGSLVINIKNLSIYADPLLEKVFYNLVENALRHGEEVSRITFSSILSEDSITIVCEDNGKGIPDKFKEAIFNRQHFKNTGFGLFLSREILGITGLSIKETGEQGKGGRFEITGPREYFRVEGQSLRDAAV